MTKRKLAWGAICIALLVSVIGAGWAFFGTHEITMTQAELQQKIDTKMPYTTQNGVTVSNVKLDLSGDKIGLSVDASATKLGTEFLIGAQTSGNLRYDNASGAFYFSPDTLKMTRMEANGTKVSEKVGAFIDKWVDSKKILDNKAELTTAAEEIVHTMVQKSAETVLTRVPVYTLPNDLKGTVVRAFLKDVEVKNGTIIAHLSLWQFTLNVIAFLFVLVIAIGLTIVLLANPELGTALLIIGSLGD
jgi:hypothetical protein